MEDKRKYTITEKAIQAHKDSIKLFDETNEKYFAQFAESKTVSTSSLPQYRSAVRRFSEHVQKDLISVTVIDIENYVNSFDNAATSTTQERFIKTFLKFIFICNTEQSITDADSNTLLWLLESDAKQILKILMGK